MDLRLMNLLGISTHKSWVDHPTQQGYDPYRHTTQYVNQSGWASQLFAGEQLPASHLGGVLGGVLGSVLVGVFLWVPSQHQWHEGPEEQLHRLLPGLEPNQL